MFLILAIILGAVCADQLTKWLAVIYLQGEPSFPLWKDVLHFTFVKNEGAAFGMLSNHRWVFMIFSTVAIIGLLIYLLRFRPKPRLVQITLAMIIGGGIGNMIDRILLGYVIDFIDFTLIDFAVFNVADSFVTVGAFLLMGYLVWEIIRDSRAAKTTLTPPSATGAEEETHMPADPTDSTDTDQANTNEDDDRP